jgi:hypothetical protein
MNEPPDLSRDKEAAAQMAAKAVSNYLRECGITEQSDKRMWISRVFDVVRAKELIH